MYWGNREEREPVIEPLDAQYERALAHMRGEVLAGLILGGLSLMGLVGGSVVAVLWAAGVL